MWSTIGKKLPSAIRPITITVEGNIGCGKTTFLNYLAERQKNVCFLTEPVTQWRNLDGHNLLKMMYTDPKKWGFTFQTYVQLTMLQMHVFNDTDRPFKIMERSLHSAMHCFVENLYRTGIMETEQKIVLEEWYKWLKGKGYLDVDLIVYLKSSPETALHRIHERGRHEEKTSVSLDLLQNLHNLHERWLCEKQVPVPAPVIILDADRPLDDMLPEYDRVREILSSQLVMKRTM